MDFFDRQDEARRSTGRLVLLFVLAVVVIVVAVYAIVTAIAVFQGGSRPPGHDVPPVPLFDPIRLAAVAGGVVLVVGLASLYKVRELGGSGRVVAEQLGGRLLDRGTSDPLERRLLNVVEEMAIASGTPVPPVYLLDEEEGINAFAAGTGPEDAVLGVTRGALVKLSRAELQGVVGHEFSHVLNGDVRLNLRLIGVLFGILVLGVVGWTLLRVGFFAPRGRGGRDGGGAVVAIAVLGIGLVVVGAIGTFFGRLIQAAVSRQRELLADASSVQFTRDPDGLAGALKKIAGYPSGSRVQDAHASEVAHMLFGRAGSSALSALLSTHPPVERRIRRLEPTWEPPRERLAEPDEGDLARAREEAQREEGQREEAAAPGVVAGLAATTGTGAPAPAAADRGAGPADTGHAVARALAASRGRIGRPADTHVRRARRLLQDLPPALRAAAEEPHGARAVIVALVLSEEPSAREAQFRAVEEVDGELAAELRRLEPGRADLAAEARLPLLDLALGSLHRLTPGQARSFRAALDAAVESDARVDLLELALRTVVHHHLAATAGERPGRRAARPLPLSAAGDHVAAVLGLLARIGHRDEAAAAEAYRAGVGALALREGLGAMPPEAPPSRVLEPCLEALGRLRPDGKRRFLLACEAVIAADDRVTLEEAEVYRAIAEALGVPVPPLLPDRPD